MTRDELIEFLQTFPKDTIIGIVYQLHSDYEIMEKKDIKFYGKVEYDKDRNEWYKPKRYVLRNGKLMEYDEHTWPVGEVPQFVPLLIFPGN